MARGHLKCWKHFSGEWGPHLSPISPRNCCKSFERSVRAWTTSARLSIFFEKYNSTSRESFLNGIWYLYVTRVWVFSEYTTLLRKYCITISKEMDINGPMDRKSRLREKWVQWEQGCEINGPHLLEHGLLLSCCPIKTWCGATELQPGHESNTSKNPCICWTCSIQREGLFCKLLEDTKYLGSVDSK